ncbi:MAG TPA: DCC1-like thiol-disulfide oxidoreductase family protein [Bryobacteraceae bacterium]|nr:DCC1-like thiol-disulfide oxidoreductase family protein [Bryobacteraceae bacterium]
MQHLTAIYDPDCGLCARIASWLRSQPKWIPLRLVPSSLAGRLYPALAGAAFGQELIVVSDEGGVYLGDRAWLTCLHALRRYRSLARRLARPALLPLARQAFHFVSSHRYRISKWLEILSDSEIQTELGQIQVPRCHGIHR